MQEKKFNFTEDRLRKIEPAATDKREYYSDTTTTGLRLQVTKTGNKTFHFQVWSSEKQRPVIVTLGKWPALPLQDARDKAVSLLSAVHDGEDPQYEKRQKRETMTVSAILDLYMTEHSIPHKRSWKDDEGKIRLHLKPAFGNRRITEISTESIRSWHTGLTKTMTKAAANRHLALLRAVYNVMLPKHPNPCQTVKMFKEYSRDRFLQPEELEKFFLAVEEERQGGSPDISDYVLLSLYTGARRSNVLAMKWNDLDFNREQWRITGQEAKGKSIMLIPLVGEVLEILSRRRDIASSVFVFPSHGKTGHLAEPYKGWVRILNRAGLDGVRLHDLRRSMGSYQTMTGASTAVVGKTLGHKHAATTAVYARMNLDPVRDAMEKAVEMMHAPVKKKIVNIK